MRPKAAATPTATTPEPYSRPIANIVAAAALEVEVDAAEEELPEEAAVAEGALELELELVVVGAAVKFAGSRCPQFAFSLVLQTLCAAASFSPALIQF
jgi:hypothetical protein